MTDLYYLSAIAGGILTLALLPLLCLSDWKTRSISDSWLIAYLAAGIVPVGILYLNGLPWTYFAVSVFMCIVWLAIRRLRGWGGGDTKFLMVFSVICPLNPLNIGQHFYQWQFLIVLGLVFMLVTLLLSRRKDLPLMLPIAASILISMVGGIF